MGTPSKHASSSARNTGSALPPVLAKHIGYLLNRPAAMIRAKATHILKPLHLIPPHFAVMAILKEKGSLTQRALGDALKVDPATMVWLIDHLEKRAVVRRRAHPKDRRAHWVTLTRHGHSVFAQAERRLDRVEREFLFPLSKRESQTLGKLLSKLFRDVPVQTVPRKLFGVQDA